MLGKGLPSAGHYTDQTCPRIFHSFWIRFVRRVFVCTHFAEAFWVPLVEGVRGKVCWHYHTGPSEMHSQSTGNMDTARKRPLCRLSSATSIMDERYRGTLQRHYRVLIANINLTNDIIEEMAKEKILPDAMIKDILAGETKEERNEQLLNSLRLRGNNSFKRFRDLMYRTGNFFIADLLWEEDDNPVMLDIQDLRRFPGMLDCLQEEYQKKLVQYLESKVREKALMLSWRGSPVDRMESLQARATDYNQEKVLREMVMNQEETIKQQETTIAAKEEQILRLNMDVAKLQKTVEQLKQDHRASLDTHSRFHDANINTISKLREKTLRVSNSLQTVNEMLRDRLAIENKEKHNLSCDDSEDACFAELEKNIASLLDRLKAEEGQNESFREQRDEILTLLNRRQTKDSLVAVVKDMLRHEQKHRTVVMRDILKLTDTLKPVAHGKKAAASGNIEPAMLDTKLFKAHLAVLKVEAEHVHKRLSWKDTEIATLRAEVTHLQDQLALPCDKPPLPSASSPVPPSCSPAPFPRDVTAGSVSGSPLFLSSSDVTPGAGGSLRTPVCDLKISSSESKQSPRGNPDKLQSFQRRPPSKSPLPAGAKGRKEASNKLSSTSGMFRKPLALSSMQLNEISRPEAPGMDNGYLDLDQTLVDVNHYLLQVSPSPSSASRILSVPGDVKNKGDLK